MGSTAGGPLNPILDAIHSRRNTKKLRAEPPPTREQIETIIEAATWAPNHHMTEPWRFVVVGGEERRRLGDALTEALMSTFPETTKQMQDIERVKPLDAPVIVTVIASPKMGPKIVAQEEMIAAGAALQNALLAAESMGLGTMIRTGLHGFSERMREYFDMKQGESLVGMVYVGYTSEAPQAKTRTDYREKTIWRGM